MTYAIDGREVSRRYGAGGGFEAVRAVSFSVDRGELFALLGTNGAGKTSILEVVEGLARPSAGSVRVLGHDPFVERAAVRPRLGVMLQEGGFAADLTVAETVRMWAGTLSDPRPAGEALELVELGHRARTAVKQLSGGERRRLDLALAVAGHAEVFFLDEPTTGLDPESRRAAWRLIRGLLSDGATVLMTTHYLEEAQELADRLAIMHQGRIVVSGTVAEVVAAYPGRVSFLLPDGVTPEELPALPGAGQPVPGRGRQLVLTTECLQETLHGLLSWAAAHGIALPGLDARSASLEEAFLAIANEPATADTPRRTLR